MSFEAKLTKRRTIERSKTAASQSQQLEIERQKQAGFELERERQSSIEQEINKNVDINYIRGLLRTIINKIDLSKRDFKCTDLHINVDYGTKTGLQGVEVRLWHFGEPEYGIASEDTLIGIRVIKQGKLDEGHELGRSAMIGKGFIGDRDAEPIINQDEYLIFLDTKLSAYEKRPTLMGSILGPRAKVSWVKKVSTKDKNWKQQLETALIDKLVDMSLL